MRLGSAAVRPSVLSGFFIRASEPVEEQPRLRCMTKSLQHQIIGRALELIADGAHWTRGEAIKFCAVGALARAAIDLLGSTVNTASLAAATAKEVMAANGATRCLQQINDIEGHAAAVRALQRALE
jgi:hypothetical protein